MTPGMIVDGKILANSGEWLTPTQLLRKVQQQIKTFPLNYDQEHIIKRTLCGTVACIGGWCCLLTGRNLLDTYTRHTHMACLEDMSEFLSDGDSNFVWLFRTEFFASVYHKDFKAAKNRLEQAKIAVAAIDDFIAEIEAEGTCESN